ncbi:MAG: hypothetical protein E2P02_24305 [Acidobacteria bacterium]|nr:MAG: hypothetical protein E2P02_24305 [Acidobacteriota bacterium]
MAYRVAVSFVRWLLRIFFHRVEVTGLANIPEDGGGLVVSWHPNAIIDGGLVLAHFPRQIVLGARHGLFAWPVLGPLMRALEIVPVYRRQDFAGSDEEMRREANRKSLDVLAEAIAGGKFAALFPEGDSHDEPFPKELKTGAARLYYRARELTPENAPPPVIIPIGLHYDQKRLLGSSVLVAIHPPLELDEALSANATGEAKREQYRRLTQELERVLHQVVHATESWQQHHAMHRGRKLLRAERAHRAGASPPRPDMKERVLAFSRMWTGYNALMGTQPKEIEQLFARVREYDENMRELGLHDHELDSSPRLASPWLGAILVLQMMLVYLLLPPILILGYIVNMPTALAVLLISKKAARKQKDEASLKLVAGAIAFPVTWFVVAVLVALGNRLLEPIYPAIPGSPLLTGVTAFFLSAASAYLVLNYQRLARQTLRSIRVRLTRYRRKAALEQLRMERRELYDAFTKLSEGLALPGRLEPDGRVVEAIRDDA